MSTNLQRLIIVLGVLACSLIEAPRALAALTLGATSITSDANLVLSPTTNLGIGNVNPQALLHLGTAGTRAGIIKVDGSTSGTITIQPAAAAGTWTFTLPTSAGTNGQVLTTNGSGVTSWTTVAGGGITNGAGANIIPKSDGVNLVASRISDSGPGDNITLAANSPDGGNSILLDVADDSGNQGSVFVYPNLITAQTTGTFCAGDCDGNANSTKLSVDDLNQQTFLVAGDSGDIGMFAGNNLIRVSGGNLTNGISLVAPTINIDSSAAGFINIGDTNGAGNGTVARVDDSNRVINLEAGDGTLQVSHLGSVKTTTISPFSVAGADLGTRALPFVRVYIGVAATNNIEISGTATAARVITLPDASGIVQLSSTTDFASLPTCNSTTDGMTRGVNNSNTNIWGANIAGGGANHVLAFCNGTVWTVAGK